MTKTTPAAFGHQCQRQPSQAHLCVTVEPHRVARVGARLQSAGCVEHQHIQTTKTPADFGQHRHHGLLVGDIGLDDAGLAARRPNRVDDGVCALGLLSVVHHDVMVRPGELSGDLSSDAAGGAGHQDDLGHDPWPAKASVRS